MHKLFKKHFILRHDDTNRTSDIDLFRDALSADGCLPSALPLHVIRRDYHVIRDSGFDVTAAILWDGSVYHVCSIEPGDTCDRLYGVAVDLGSTTVVARVLDLNTGASLAEYSVRNRQREFGDEILSRIFYGHESREHLDVLQRLTADSINAAAEEACIRAGVKLSAVSFMALAGNTTMIHFLLGVDAFCVFHAPFITHLGVIGWLPANDLGLNFPGSIYCFPSAANYLGGDIVSGVLSTGMTKSSRVSLFIDIGTNGEMVIGNHEFLIGGAGAAGPALEAGISKSGMRAKEGAVEGIRIENGVMSLSVIGNGKPVGICGSGIVDLLAQMLLAGWLDISGNLVPGASDRIISINISEDDEPDIVNAVIYAYPRESANGETLMFTQRDIDQFTHSKAAAHTMVASLLRESGFTLDDVEHIYLAGAFGKYMKVESAITIGMYPDVPRDRFIPVGNSSLEGAADFLLGKFSETDANDIAESVYFLEFAMQNDFLTLMQAASFYPHTDLNAYPGIAKRLGLIPR